jgi:hypothetical protein
LKEKIRIPFKKYRHTDQLKLKTSGVSFLMPGRIAEKGCNKQHVSIAEVLFLRSGGSKKLFLTKIIYKAGSLKASKKNDQNRWIMQLSELKSRII